MARRFCDSCKIYISESNWARHLNTKKHQNKGKTGSKKNKKNDKRKSPGSQNFSAVIRRVFCRKYIYLKESS